MDYDLAIIIPAWKTDYLRESIESILAQCDKRFTLYIFDDASPNDIESTVRSVNIPENVRFHRFDENLGQHSLVNHWNRCIVRTGNEKWVWLFSDDDMMTPDCVASFYQSVENFPGYAAYRFNTHKIGPDGKTIRENNFPEVTDAVDFLNLKLSYSQESYIVETIFSRDAYNTIEGIPEMPLAWTADDLFNVKLALHGRIRTISGGLVYWRYSKSNISGEKNRGSAKIKLKASKMFINWLRSEKMLKDQLNPPDLPVLWYVRQIRSLGKQLTLPDEWKAVWNILFDETSVLKHYLKMKIDRSKFFGWLKKYSL
ncbi:MAG: glycosyltransferase family 2 protein [Balneolaceae bacterium]|nr:MAG: glycosyltransferase family 2 protein [Balneolaceae bacterium]